MSNDGADAELGFQEWQIVCTDWWKTSFRSISWSYPASHTQRARSAYIKPIASGSGKYARPPHYHDLLYRTRRREWTPSVSQADLELSASLPGVTVVEEVIRPYEISAGIRPTIDTPVEDAGERTLFDGRVDQEDIVLARTRWSDEVRALLGGVLTNASPSFDDLIDQSLGPDRKIWDLTLLDSPLSSNMSDLVDLTDSEVSVESEPPPMTPRATSAQFSPYEVAAPHPGKPLNASAVSFVPSASTPSPPFGTDQEIHSPSPAHEFAFPSLCADNPAASPAARRRSLLLQKDGDGFYHPVDGAEPGNRSESLNSHRSATPRRPSADLLPAFLADGASSSRTRVRNTSRTREIVDRLRSGRWNGKKTVAKSAKDGLESSTLTLPSDTRGLTKEETIADSFSESTKALEVDGWICAPTSETPQISEDGWIAGPSSPLPINPKNTSTPARNTQKRSHKHGHKRSASSTSSRTGSASGSGSSASFSPPTPSSSFGASFPSPMFPPTPGLPISPFLGAAAYSSAPLQPPSTPAMAQYMQMQVQAHIQQVQAQQWQMQARGLGAGYYGLPAGPMMAMAGQPALYGGSGKGLMAMQ